MSRSSKRKLRIALDARWIFERISGVGRVTENLLRNLPIIDKANEYVFIFDDQERMEQIVQKCELDAFQNVEKVLFPFGILKVCPILKT